MMHVVALQMGVHVTTQGIFVAHGSTALGAPRKRTGAETNSQTENAAHPLISATRASATH